MALRSLDNALSITPERPKKIAKISFPTSKVKPSDFSVNDENMAPVPVSGDVVIDYVSSEDLTPLDDPEIQIQILMGDLESKDWIKVCESLNVARRFALHHSILLLPTLEKVMIILVKAMKNPRSALCKTSIMTASDIFKSYGHDLLESSTSEAFDQLLLQLLLKSSQDKRFVCEEADKALFVMVASIPPLPLLKKLRAFVSHSNPRVRAKAAVSFAQCVSEMGLEVMKEFGQVSLIQIAAEILNDRLPEAREAARKTVTSVYKAFEGDDELKNSELTAIESWQNFCTSNLSAIQAQSLIKIVTT
ncbi:Arm repeat superfamily protein [Thalictrum thalictroides]|uniref:Arm repeat superfamily protein n=1 Tax=Thalictrum thalictroides TaxID=46969 RepID=A0A7J6VWG8_THATH|nr:Arm repeat superfamily protein [Thalictrum thalictroides]